MRRAGLIWNDLIRVVRLPRAFPPRAEILFITNMWPDERRPYYGSFIASQAHSLSAAGIGVDVAYVRGYLGAHGYAKATATLPRVAGRRPYDLIHVHYGHTAAASLAVRQRPLIVSFCGEDVIGAQREGGLTLKSRVELRLFRQLGHLADATITKSRDMHLALPPSLRARDRILPNGVDHDRFSPRPRAEARERLGWDLDEKVMLFLGNPRDPRKRIGLAAEAAEIVGRRRAGTRLHVAWGIEPTAVPTYMNAADCLVFPSRGEGSPNVIKEAMACELPIVATRVGDIPERLDGVAGCVTCDPTPAAFADALLRSLDVDRAPAARRAVRSLGIERVADRLLSIYGEIGAEIRPPFPQMTTA